MLRGTKCLLAFVFSDAIEGAGGRGRKRVVVWLRRVVLWPWLFIISLQLLIWLLVVIWLEVVVIRIGLVVVFHVVV